MTQSEKQKLLPCPFCGSSLLDTWKEDGLLWRTKCMSCGARCGLAETIELAYQDWNARTITDERRDWRPISEAPRGGTRVLVSDGKYVLIAYWNNEPSVWEKEINGCWTVYEPEDYFYAWHLIDDAPTHWMPLPAPPTAAGDLEGE